MWDLKLLKTFVAVVDRGRFTAAAGCLHLTQSAVSHQIRRLETQLGTRLFQRSRAECRLTADGDRLYRDVAQLVHQADALWQTYRSDELQGVIRVGAADDGFTPVLAAALKQFSAAHPKVYVDFEIGLTREIQSRFNAGEFDLVLVRCRADELFGEPLLEEPLNWYVPDEFHLADTKPIPLAAGPFPCLYRETMTHGLERAGLAYDVVVTCPSHIGIKTAVQSGMAVSALPASLLTGLKSEQQNGAAAHLPTLPRSKLTIARQSHLSEGTSAYALYTTLLTLKQTAEKQPSDPTV